MWNYLLVVISGIRDGALQMKLLHKKAWHLGGVSKESARIQHSFIKIPIMNGRFCPSHSSFNLYFQAVGCNLGAAITSRSCVWLAPDRHLLAFETLIKEDANAKVGQVLTSDQMKNGVDTKSRRREASKNAPIRDRTSSSATLRFSIQPENSEQVSFVPDPLVSQRAIIVTP